MLKKASADVVVVGAGVAGCSAFYALAKHAAGNQNRSFKPLLIDAMSPMSLTSARGTFAYRNWWPGAGEESMMRLVSRSIDIFDEIAAAHNNEIELNRNGYLFVTRREGQVKKFREMAKNHELLGGGAVRVHLNGDSSIYNPSTKYHDKLDGCDLILGHENILKLFPSLKESGAIAVLHVRRAGSLNPFKLVSIVTFFAVHSAF